MKSALRLLTEQDVLPQGHRQDHAVPLAVFGDQSDPGSAAVEGGEVADVVAVEGHDACRRDESDNGVDHLGLPIALDSGDADDLAGMDLDRHSVEGSVRRHRTWGSREQVGAGGDAERDLTGVGVGLDDEIGDRQEDPVGHRALAGLRGRELGADHHLGELLGRHRRWIVDFAHRLAGADHGDRVGVLEHLVELVGDEDDRRFAGGQLAQRREQLVDLVGNEHGGRLVENQDLGVPVEHLEDLDTLLLADAEVGHELVGVDLQPVTAAEGADPAARRVARDDRPARLATEDDVLPHREVVGEHEVLEHHADAVADRGRGGAEVLHLAVDEDRSLVGLMGAVERLHQRRLAGPVLADDGVDRAAPNLEVDAVVGDDTWEALDDVAQFDRVVVAGGRPPVDGLRHDTHVPAPF